MIKYENENKNKNKNNQVHASDYDCNPVVVEAIALARSSENARYYIDYLGNGKDVHEVRRDKSNARINQRKEGLVMNEENEGNYIDNLGNGRNIHERRKDESNTRINQREERVVMRDRGDDGR